MHALFLRTKINIIKVSAFLQKDNILDVKLAIVIGQDTLEGEYNCQFSVENGDTYEFATFIHEQV